MKYKDYFVTIEKDKPIPSPDRLYTYKDEINNTLRQWKVIKIISIEWGDNNTLNMEFRGIEV